MLVARTVRTRCAVMLALFAQAQAAHGRGAVGRNPVGMNSLSIWASIFRE